MTDSKIKIKQSDQIAIDKKKNRPYPLPPTYLQLFERKKSKQLNLKE